MTDIERAQELRRARELAREAALPHVVGRYVCRACGHGDEGTPVYSVHPATADPTTLECPRCHATTSAITPLYWCEDCGGYLGEDPNVEHVHQSTP